tara:strand:- start:2497 stop:5145 length:2649 start_codon:yes stop_codon:yes gene_type:complete
MSRKGFLLGGIGTFWHVMVWALAMIADLLMMNMIHRDLQYTAWVYWRFGFGTMVFGFVMFSGTSIWHIVSDDQNKFHDGDAPPWLMSIMIGSAKASAIITGLQMFSLNLNQPGGWDGLIPGDARPDLPAAAIQGQHNTWVLLLIFSLSMKVLAYYFVRNNQEWAGPKQALKTEGPFGRPSVSAILFVLVFALCAAIGVLWVVYGEAMIREIVVLGVIAGVTLVTICCLGDNHIVMFGRFYMRTFASSEDVVLTYSLVSMGVAFAIAGMMIGILTGANYIGVVIFFVALSVVTLSVVSCCGPRPLLGLALGKLDTSNSRTELAYYAYFSTGIAFVTAATVIFAIYGDAYFLTAFILALIGVVTMLVVCFAGQNPLVRLKRREPAITPSLTPKREIFGPTLGTYVFLMLLLAIPVTLAFVYLVIEWRADAIGIIVVLAAVLFFFMCCVCGQNLLPWLIWRDREGMVETAEFGEENVTYIFFTIGFVCAGGAVVVLVMTQDLLAAGVLGVAALLVFVFSCCGGPRMQVFGAVQKGVDQKIKVSIFSYFLTMVAIFMAAAVLLISLLTEGQYLIVQIVLGCVAVVILAVTLFCGPRPLAGIPCRRNADSSATATITTYLTFVVGMVLIATAAVLGIANMSIVAVIVFAVLGALIVGIACFFGEQPVIQLRQRPDKSRAKIARTGPNTLSYVLTVLGVGLPIAAIVLYFGIDGSSFADNGLTIAILLTVGAVILCVLCCCGMYPRLCCNWRYRKYRVPGRPERPKTRGPADDAAQEEGDSDREQPEDDIPLFRESEPEVLTDPEPIIKPKVKEEPEKPEPGLPQFDDDYVRERERAKLFDTEPTPRRDPELDRDVNEQSSEPRPRPPPRDVPLFASQMSAPLSEPSV